MCSYRVALVVGHESEAVGRPRFTGETHDWRVYVRGARGEDITRFVQKIVFYLHRSYTYPKRVIHEPPFEIKESGFGCFNIPINIYIKHSSNPSKIKFKYKLYLQSHPPFSGSKEFSHTFEEPSESLKACLLEGGAELIEKDLPVSVGMAPRKELPQAEVFSGDSRKHDDNFKRKHSANKLPTEGKRMKCKTAPRAGLGLGLGLEAAHEPKRCSDTGGEATERSTLKELMKALGGVSMAESEIGLVSQLYVSLCRYEKCSDRLTLPSFSDPIYRAPELPSSLRAFLPEGDECGGYVLR